MKTILFALTIAFLPMSSRALSPTETLAVVRTIDGRERSSGDWKAVAYVENKEKDKDVVVKYMVVYRRDAERKMLFLFTAPKSEEGKGYLKIDRNLWFFDPNTGRWERRTERERLGGTDSRRQDFESNLAEEYDATWEGLEKLGRFDVHRIRLDVKPGVDVAFPVVRIWVDAATNNVLKRQEMAVSGRLMRTSFYPRWTKIYSESKRADVWFPEEMRIYDEIETDNQTIILIKEIDVRPLDPNLFTKAWLEARSR